MKEPGTTPSNTPEDRSARTYEGWISVFECSTDFEADLVRDRLGESDIAAVVLTQRDHAFNLNVGDLAPVHVMVKPSQEEEARALLAEAPLSDAELEAAAMEADISAPDAYSPDDEARLDSGIEEISLDVPDEEE
ncbi:putative signal transducing protein [Rubrivirga sp.]|uniref:putative signal transducing protein n=1 Tax=Rubrivirga sp. TaxID=1885344 RepID=UPI003C746184